MHTENKLQFASFSNIRVVLVNTSHPGNIGASARAMKTMGLNNLYLVAPDDYPSKKADVLAASALDVLENAKIFTTLDAAIADCHLVFGASARMRVMPQDVLTAREAAEKIIFQPDTTNIGLVFGREDSGLTNIELQKCHYHLHIPASADYSALNLAQAVQICCYELRMAGIVNAGLENKFIALLPSANELEKLYQHIQKTMVAIKFLNPENPRRMLPRLRRIFTRANIDKDDVDLLHGMMSSIDRYTDGK